MQCVRRTSVTKCSFLVTDRHYIYRYKTQKYGDVRCLQPDYVAIEFYTLARYGDIFAEYRLGLEVLSPSRQYFCSGFCLGCANELACFNRDLYTLHVSGKNGIWFYVAQSARTKNIL